MPLTHFFRKPAGQGFDVLVLIGLSKNPSIGTAHDIDSLKEMEKMVYHLMRGLQTGQPTVDSHASISF